MVFDPFAFYDESQIDEVSAADVEMFTVEVGGKVLGIDEGMIVGIVIGLIAAQFLG